MLIKPRSRQAAALWWQSELDRAERRIFAKLRAILNASFAEVSRQQRTSVPNETAIIAASQTAAQKMATLLEAEYAWIGTRIATQLAGDVEQRSIIAAPEQKRILDGFEGFMAAWARFRAGERVVDLQTETRRQLRTAVVQAITERVVPSKLAQRIRTLGRAFSSRRARTIARNEMADAAQAATDQVIDSLPPGTLEQGTQEWVTVRDGRERPEHAAADGQTVPVGDAFIVGGEALARPRDPNGSAGNVINCRCSRIFE